MPANRVNDYGGHYCNCLDLEGNETKCGNCTECVLASIFSPCYYGVAMKRALNKNPCLWGLGCLVCGLCGFAAEGINQVNENLGGDDLCFEFAADYCCCCCCLWTCSTARFYRVVRRQYVDKDHDGVYDGIDAPAPQHMERDEYFKARSTKRASDKVSAEKRSSDVSLKRKSKRGSSVRSEQRSTAISITSSKTKHASSRVSSKTSKKSESRRSSSKTSTGNQSYDSLPPRIDIIAEQDRLSNSNSDESTTIGSRKSSAWSKRKSSIRKSLRLSSKYKHTGEENRELQRTQTWAEWFESWGEWWKGEQPQPQNK